MAPLLSISPISAQEIDVIQEAEELVVTAAEFRAQLAEETGFTIEEWAPAWQLTREDFELKQVSDKVLASWAVKDHGQIGYHLYGAPMNRRELKEISERAIHDRELEAVLEVADSFGTFSGQLTDYRGIKMRTVLRFTEKLSRSEKNELRSLVTDSSRLKFRSDGKHTLRDLQAQAKLLFDQGTYGGATLHGVMIDQETQTIEVMMTQAEWDKMSVSSELVAELAPVEAVVGDQDVAMRCPNRNNCTNHRFRGA